MQIPNDEASLLSHARQYEQQGLLLKALTLYKHGAQLHPESLELAAGVARLTKQLEAGVADGPVHVDRKPGPSKDPAVMFEQAKVYLKYGLSEKASATLREILEAAPQHAEAKRLLASLTGGR
jgi:FimV-like protein